MKKTLFVVALATMLVFAVAGSALAVNQSNQLRLGAAATASSNVKVLAPGQTNPVAGAGTNIYMDWLATSSLGTNGTDNTPHGNYTTTTVKCVVCHSVHYAAPGGAPVSGGVGGNDGTQVADTLLRMRADQSCVFCHATANGTVNGRPVYNGLGAAANVADGGNSTVGHETGANCSVCHTSVHGGGQDNSVAALSGYLLNTMPITNPQNMGPDSANMLDAITAIDLKAHSQGFAFGAALNGQISDYANTTNDTLREQAVGIFCAECHNGAYATAAAGASTNVRGSDTVSYSGHRINATAGSNWNGASDKVSSSALSNISVAWAPIDNSCKSCHDAKDNYGNVAFPHAWGTYDGTNATTIAASGAKMWLLSAQDAVSPKTPVAPAGGGTYNTTSPQLYDGVCLKCHVASGGSAGVGITF